MHHESLARHAVLAELSDVVQRSDARQEDVNETSESLEIVNRLPDDRFRKSLKDDIRAGGPRQALHHYRDVCQRVVRHHATDSLPHEDYILVPPEKYQRAFFRLVRRSTPSDKVASEPHMPACTTEHFDQLSTGSATIDSPHIAQRKSDLHKFVPVRFGREVLKRIAQGEQSGKDQALNAVKLIVKGARHSEDQALKTVSQIAHSIMPTNRYDILSHGQLMLTDLSRSKLRYPGWNEIMKIEDMATNIIDTSCYVSVEALVKLFKRIRGDNGDELSIEDVKKKLRNQGFRSRVIYRTHCVFIPLSLS